MGHEGYYSNDKTDRGGETYRGISRRYHPHWAGWKIIDDAKKLGSDFPSCLQKFSQFDYLNMNLVPQFYREKYWDVFEANEYEPAFQMIADELFDTAVNMGVYRAALFLQKALNILVYRKGVITTPALIEDGRFGKNTFKALTQMKKNHIKVLYNLMNIMQANHYLDYIARDERQAKFLVGWLNRVEIAKS